MKQKIIMLIIGLFCIDIGLYASASGASCTENINCDSGNCSAGLCEGCNPTSVPCDSDGQCCSSICVMPDGLTARCSCYGPAGSWVVNCPCSSNSDCESGNCTNGFCMPCNPTGMLCSTNEQCCSGSCVNGLCQDPSQDGMVCSNDANCDSGNCSAGLCEACNPTHNPCNSDGQCCSSICVMPDGLTATCSCNGPAGSWVEGCPCSSNSDCEFGNCINGVCQDPSQDGMVCSNDANCDSGNCSAGLCEACNPNSVPCDSDGQCCSSICVMPDGLTATCSCNGPAGSWVEGCPCSSNSDCESGNCTNGFCMPCNQTGMVCSTNEQCCSGSCVMPDGGTIAMCSCNGPAGSWVVNCPCSSNSDCESGNCINGLCQPPCNPTGTPCSTNEQCCSGNCINGLCEA